MNASRAVRLRLQAGLMLAGAIAGALVGAGMTVLGKIVTGAPAATSANYVWNMAAFGLMAAVVSPLVTWSALRRVPLWRTVVEPLAGALVGAGIGVALGSGVAFLLLAPLGLAAAMFRLARRYRDPAVARLTADATLVRTPADVPPRGAQAGSGHRGAR
jgi:hypothetical protein